MPFPDAECGIVTREKVCDYLLDLTHPVGGTKAAWFLSLGYSLDNWQQLANDFLRIANTCEDFIAKSSPYGVKYEVFGEIGCLGCRPAVVATVWIVEANRPARLITA